MCAHSAAVQQCLMTSSVWEAIRAVDSMAVLDFGLTQSGCFNLQDFLRETLCFWHKIIKERLARYFCTLRPSYFVTLCLNIVIIHLLFKLNHFFFSSDFEKLLIQLHWPITTPPTQSLAATANCQEISSQLDLIVTQLLALQTSYPFVFSLAFFCFYFDNVNKSRQEIWGCKRMGMTCSRLLSVCLRLVNLVHNNNHYTIILEYTDM